MKNIKLKYCSVLVSFLFLFGACEELTDIQQEYLDRGEQIYVGKVDSLTTDGGYYRIRISGLMDYASTADKCVIRWTSSDIEDSVVIQSSEWKSTNVLNVLLDGLSEESYRFFVQTFDKEGNKSLNEEISGTVYGDNYILQISPKIITRVRKYNNTDVILSWTASSENVSFVEMKYETNSEVKKLILPSTVETDTIKSDWKEKGKIEYRTASIPEYGALDTLYTAWRTEYFP